MWDAWMLQSDLGNDGLALDLLEWKVPKPSGQPPKDINEIGFHHLTFAVPDLQACVERLRDAGVTIVGGPIDMDLGNGRASQWRWCMTPTVYRCNSSAVATRASPT
jgi:catechol 2,3-dioxygenase-like lactoylglutathione lyase family enzyme